MSIIYRSEKGAPLSAEEIDGNFKELETRLKSLEEHHEVAESLCKIDIHGDQVTFIGAFGTAFGTFALPKATLKPRGPWLTETAYQPLDVVTGEGSLYSCLKEHVSTTWEHDNKLWQEILSLPKPPETTLSLYEESTLPKEESLGKLALLLGKESPTLIFFNGKTWQRLMKGDLL